MVVTARCPQCGEPVATTFRPSAKKGRNPIVFETRAHDPSAPSHQPAAVEVQCSKGHRFMVDRPGA